MLTQDDHKFKVYWMAVKLATEAIQDASESQSFNLFEDNLTELENEADILLDNLPLLDLLKFIE